MAKELFIFDFDLTITARCTDQAVNELLSQDAQKKVKSMYKDGPTCKWQEKMQFISDNLHAQGNNEDEVRAALSRIKLNDGMSHLLKYIREHPEKFVCIIISDANEFYINTLLKVHNLEDTFDRIFTNHAAYNEHGRLVLRQCHTHTHDVCPDNMCKRELLRLFLEQGKTCGIYYRTLRYVGDGENDLCPGESLNLGDNLYVRKGYGLDRKLAKQAVCERVKARVVKWKSGDDILRDLLKSQEH